MAIEKDGVIGLRRDPSYEPSPSRRPPSTDMETASNSSVIGADDTYKTPRKRFGNDPIPESPRDISAPIGRDAFQEKLAAVAEKSNPKPEKPVEEVPAKPFEKPETVKQEPAKPVEKPVEKTVAAAAPTTKPAPAKPAVAATRARSNSPVKTSAPAEKAKPTAKDASKENEKPKGQARLAVAKPAVVRKAASTIGLAAANKSAAPTKPAAKTQAGPTKSTPSTAAKSSDAKPTSRLAERAAARKPATTTTTSSTNASKTTRPPPLKPTQASDTGFVKPKPKSPTKPVSLPASLTAPTASSVSKGNAARGQSKSSLQAPSTTNRAPSRTSVAGSGTSSKPTKPTSTTRSRPSLGVPPKKAEPEAAPRRESHVDESFLARMMRPTQASSSKTTEKVPLTPPKKTTHWVPSNGASGSRRSSSVRASTQPGSPSTARSVGSNAEESSLLAVDESAVEIEEPEPAAPAPAKQIAKAVEVAPAKEPKINTPQAEVKPKPEVEAKPEPKVEATPEPEGKPKDEIKSEPEPEIKAEPEVEAKPEPEVEETKPEPKVEEVKPEPEVEIKTEPEVEIKSEPEVKPTPEPEVKPEPVPEVEAKPEPESEVEVKTEPEVEVKAKPDVETKAEPEIETQPEAEANPEVAITSDAEVKPELQLPSADEKTADSTAQSDTGKDSISAPLPVEEEQAILTEEKKPEAKEVSAVASS